MALTVASFLVPAGRIDPAVLFPGEDAAAINARFAAYLAQANAAIARLATQPPTTNSRDAIASAFVYFRAYDSVLDMIAARPQSFTAADEGSVSYSSAQISVFTKKRDLYLAEYNALVTELGAGVDTDGRRTTAIFNKHYF